MDDHATAHPHGATVFVATDFSPAADEALLQGHRHAASSAARLVVCHVLPSTARGVVARLTESAPPPARLTEALRSLAQRTTELTGRARADFEGLVVTGSPHASIVQAAAAHRADLLFLGDRGASSLAERVLGGVAERVARYAHCTVQVARPRHGMRTLIATDLSAASLPAISEGAHEARLRGAPVTALYCVDPDEDDVPSTWNPDTDGPHPVVDAARSRLAAAVNQFGLDAELAVLVGPPADLILRATTGVAADLVILATRGRTGLTRIVLGSVAETVLRRAPCSVRVVRHEAPA